MNTPRNEKIKWDNRIVNFTWDVFDVLWSKHKERFNERRNKQSDYFERLRKTVKEVRDEIGYDYSDIENYEKRLLTDDETIEKTKEKIRNHPKLKQLFEEYKTITWKSKWMKNKIWRDIFWDLMYEIMDFSLEKDKWKILDLELWYIWNRSEAELKEFFYWLPKWLKSLDLRRNVLWNRTWEDLKKALCWLPKSLKSIDLYQNFLWNKTGQQLKEAFSLLSKDILILNLWNNFLRNSIWVDLQELFSWLPKYIKILDLSKNNLWEIEGMKLKESFSAMPKDLKILNLYLNHLWNKSAEQLKEIFSVLPQNLTSINLWDNYLSSKYNDIIKFCNSRWINVKF